MKKRTFLDRLICTANAIRYAITEPVKLRRARQGWEQKYNPLISVYIPTYNRPKLLQSRGLQSVLNQTYRNFEVIIVDDGSNHVNYELRVGDQEESRVRYFYLPPRKHLKDRKADWLLGPTRAANFALEQCRGDWIARNDDDDIWTKDHLEKLLRFAQQNDLELVYGATEQKRYGKWSRGRFQKNLGVDAPIGSIQASLYRSYLRFFKFNKHCWRKSWNANNDLDMPLRMYKAGVRIGFLDKVVTYILPRPGETTLGLDAMLGKENGKQN